MLDTIEQSLSRLSRAEQQVAQWVLAHPRQAAHATVADVAAAAATSQPTVVRFCRSIGTSGFRELKIRLAESISRPTSYLHRDVNQDDSIADAIAKVVDRSIQSLVDLRAALTSLPIEAAVNKLATARQIIFAGSGASGHVASDACHKFFRLGIPCTAASDVPTMLQLGATANADDVLVIISQTGRSEGSISMATFARQNGASVVAITLDSSPLASNASVLIALPTLEDASVYTPMSSRLAQLAVLDALQVVLALELGDPAEERLSRSKRVLGESRTNPEEK